MEEKYILNLQEVPEGFEDVAEFLQRPLQEEALRAKLRAEEEVEAIFAQQEAEKAYFQRVAEEASAREEEERRQKEEERRQKEEERRQKELALEQVREGKIKLARVLLRTGMSAQEVALETGLTEDEVRELE